MTNILVCDDDKEIVEAIEIYLTQEGYRILKAYDGTEALEMLEREEVHLLLLDYMTELSQQSRRHPYVVTGVSPRGTLALLNASKAYAFLHERSFVVPEDIKAVAVFVLAHRLVLSRGVGSQSTGTEIIEKLLSDVAVPTENWGKHE